MLHKVVIAFSLLSVAVFTATPAANADRSSVCKSLDGLWSDRSEFVQITGRAACELTPPTPGDSLLQLQFEYPTVVADDPVGSKQLAAYISERIHFYQDQFEDGGPAGDRFIAVGVTFDEFGSGTTRTLHFTEVAFTLGEMQPVTYEETKTFSSLIQALPAPQLGTPHDQAGTNLPPKPQTSEPNPLSVPGTSVTPTTPIPHPELDSPAPGSPEAPTSTPPAPRVSPPVPLTPPTPKPPVKPTARVSPATSVPPSLPWTPPPVIPPHASPLPSPPRTSTLPMPPPYVPSQPDFGQPPTR